MDYEFRVLRHRALRINPLEGRVATILNGENPPSGLLFVMRDQNRLHETNEQQIRFICCQKT